MNNYRANMHRLGRSDRGKVVVTREGSGHPARSRVPQCDARDIIADICRESGETVCPKTGAAQWTCCREECVCHRKPYAHTKLCRTGECNCGALR